LNNGNPLVSVIIPTHNRTPLLGASMRSVLALTNKNRRHVLTS
jgi:glycosyltransferase involved in cell wall biosynthesis